MLLAIDVGNSNVKIGLLNETGRVCAKMRISSQLRRTADEYDIFIRQFVQKSGCSWPDVEGIVISSVVPLITEELGIFLANCARKPHIIVGPDAKSGLKIATDHPEELGADLLANALGAVHLSGGGSCIAIAFGTATTCSAVNENMELQGVAIAPGVETALTSLVQNTALLGQTKIEMPCSAIGRNTEEAIRAGIVLGQLGAVEYIVRRQLDELRKNAAPPVKIYSTGHFGKLYQGHSDYLGKFEEDLLFIGLHLIWRKNS